MSMRDISRKVQVGLVAFGLVLQTSPIAWAQVEGGWEAVEALVTETIPPGELHDIASDLVDQCVVNEDVARGVELEAQAIVEASETTAEVLNQVASNPNAIVTTLQSQGVTVTPEALAGLTEAAANASRALREGSTIVDPRVVEHLGALREAMEAMARNAGLSDVREFERFFAGGPPGAEGERSFREMGREMGFLVDCTTSDAMRAHFEVEMERYAAGGMGMPPREFLEQIAVTGYNPGEIMSEVAREMAMHMGPPSETMVAEGRSHMERMLNDPNVSQAEKDRMTAMFTSWEAGEMPMHSMMSPEMMSMMGPEVMAGNAVYGVTDWSAGGGTWEATSSGGTYTAHTGETWTQTGETWTSSTGETTTQAGSLTQDQQSFTDVHSPGSGTAHTLIAEHNEPGHQEGHWDSNNDGTPDHTHPLGTAPH